MTDGTPAHSTAIARLKALVDRLRPPAAQDAEQRVRAEAARLGTRPDEAAALGEALRSLLALPRQGAFYAETGVTSAQGFWLELAQRLRERLLPPLRDESRLRSILHLLFADRDDHLWVTAVADDAWLELVAALGLKKNRRRHGVRQPAGSRAHALLPHRRGRPRPRTVARGTGPGTSRIALPGAERRAVAAAGARP
jgi:site-specific recombinase